MTPSARHHWQKRCAVVCAGVILGLAVVCAITSTRWVGGTFPGFVILANRVIAAISLPHWSLATRQDAYHYQVIAVNGQPMKAAKDVYATVAASPPGTFISYSVVKGEQYADIVLPSLIFTARDYGLLFLAYLFTGLSIALTGIAVWFLQPANAASRALCVAGFATGVFGITGADLYAPHWFFRLHVVAEAVFPAAYVHLALVFPTDRLRRFRGLCIGIPYVIAAALAVAYQIFLYQPALYSFIYSLCMVYVGVAGAALLGSVLWDYWTTTSYLIRQRVRVLCLGFLSGYGLPIILLFTSGITGGEVPVNYMAFTGFLFPLSLGYAIVKHDLFDIDALVKQAAYYLALTTILTLSYLAILAVLNLLLHASDLTQSPLFPLGFTIAVVLGLNPLKEQVQTILDRLFFRLRYHPQKVLEHTGSTLISTLSFGHILPLLWNTIRDNLGVHHGSIFLLASDRNQYAPVYPLNDEFQDLPVSPSLFVTAQRRNRVLTIYDLALDSPETAGTEATLNLLERYHLQMLVPMSFKDEVIGIIALGRKESGGFFSSADRDFLTALANQGALSVANALAYQEIQTLNTSLEQKVAERTQELAQSNADLHRSLGRLEQAYQDLQRSQDNLIRAERMAALGRLTAGIAHEMNTPLGATLTTLKLLQRLVTARRATNTPSATTKRSPEEIDAEMEKLLHTTQQWMDKATAYIRSLKLHTRDLQQGEVRPFSVLQVINETNLLLGHRLRLGQCAVSISSTIENPILYGDPSKLGQILTNLLSNAIDAQQTNDSAESEITITVTEDQEALSIGVRDRGCGIPPELSERIFDEFFSTKPLGEGTGLGLSITRDIIGKFFGGTISVESTLGSGSTFTVRLPRRKKREDEPPLPPHLLNSTAAILVDADDRQRQSA